MSNFCFSDNLQRPEPSEFLCGVVEGFYGRPWTYPQRRELFRRMQSMGMNSYLYAPKDDLKHRISWREPYTDKEAENMRSLIATANHHNICFIFAISPGSDVVYSSDQDAAALIARLKQAVSLGCCAFALLFDDIDKHLCPVDQEIFASPGRAQVVFTNKVYEALNRPEVFLFCPTEYCASRAVPNVNRSAYLATLGSDLYEGIKVMWTGPLVISKRITTSSISDLSRLLKRPIVLWDNLHANDYDQRRVFLGPYAGRPLEMRRQRLLHGVLTNPNCEFEANYVAIHTLAQWARIGHPSDAHQVPISADLADTGYDSEHKDDEKEEEGGGQESNASSLHVYRPREALRNALSDWLALMLQDQRSNPVLAKPFPSHPASPTPMETDTADIQEVPMQVETDESIKAKTGSDINMVPEPVNVIQSLGINLKDLELLSDLFYLPFSHGPTALKALELGHWLRENSYLVPADKSENTEQNRWCEKFAELITIITNVIQLREKIQRLPHLGVVYDLAPYLTDITSVFAMLLDYFRWLENGVMANRSQAHLKRLLTWFSPGYSEMTTSGDYEPWMFRGGLITELQRILPLESAQDLFPAPSRVGPTVTTTPAGPLPEFSLYMDDPSLSAACKSVDAKAGFQPRRPYLLRPYKPEDKPKIYALWERILLHRLGLPGDAIPEKYKDLPGDRYLSAYLERFPQHCLVVEGPPLFFNASEEAQSALPHPERGSCATDTVTSHWDIVAFAFAAPDIGTLTRVRDDLRRGLLRVKYPKDETLCGRGKHLPMSHKFSINNTIPRLSAEDFIRISLDWIHDERINKVSSSTFAEAAVTEAPLPEPLGAAISEQQQPMAIELCEQEASKDTEKTATLEQTEADPGTCVDMVETEYAESGNEEKQKIKTKAEEEKEATVTVTANVQVDAGVKKVDGGGGGGGEQKPWTRTGEAIHSAMVAHPASVFVELDDCSFGSTGGIGVGSSMTPTTMMNHHLGLGFDPPELVLNEVARRLFVCLLAGLKTCASHGVHVELDVINEARAELYRRFGFYPVSAASTDFVTVLGRLI